MPQIFLYLLFFVIWAACAGIVWMASALMLFIPSTRRFSASLSLAMAGTFPFVIAYQILAVPFVAVVLLSGWAFWKLLEPSATSATQNPAVIVVSISVALIAFATVLTVSLAGFYDGWITGWKCGQGESFRDAVKEAPAYHWFKERVQSAHTRRSSAKRTEADSIRE